MAAAIGKITSTTPATPVAISALTQWVTFTIEALPANVGKVYIGNASNFSKSTGAGLIGILSPGGSMPVTGVLANSIYIDVDTSGDGVTGYMV